MTPHPSPAALIRLCLLPVALTCLLCRASAQEAAPAPRPAAPIRGVIFLDPAHGGADAGAAIAGTLPEKEVTLALALRLRSALAAAGFNVILARETDPVVAAATGGADIPASAPPTPGQTSDLRAGTANHARPMACLLLHATPTGTGVHLATSALPETAGAETPSFAIPWETAQAGSLPQSRELANAIGLAVAKTGLPVHLTRASVRPIDNLLCPAVALELAPPAANAAAVADAGYQERIAAAVTEALTRWRTRLGQAATAAAAAQHGASPQAAAQPAESARTPAPARTSDPARTPNPARTPAPIVRRPPSSPPESTPEARP